MCDCTLNLRFLPCFYFRFSALILLLPFHFLCSVLSFSVTITIIISFSYFYILLTSVQFYCVFSPYFLCNILLCSIYLHVFLYYFILFHNFLFSYSFLCSFLIYLLTHTNLRPFAYNPEFRLCCYRFRSHLIAEKLPLNICSSTEVLLNSNVGTSGI